MARYCAGNLAASGSGSTFLILERRRPRREPSALTITCVDSAQCWSVIVMSPADVPLRGIVMILAGSLVSALSAGMIFLNFPADGA